MKLCPITIKLQNWNYSNAYEEMITFIEKAARICYRSEPSKDLHQSEAFLEKLIKKGHESVIEHVSLTVLCHVDRGTTHELVRHRLASYSQESTRYCNYANKDLEFLSPAYMIRRQDPNREKEITLKYLEMLRQAEENYKELIANGEPPENARQVLPNALMTRIIMTTNLRDWRHLLRLRTGPAAHPNIRTLANIILKTFQAKFPVFFKDIESPTNI